MSTLWHFETKLYILIEHRIIMKNILTLLVIILESFFIYNNIKYK